MEELEEIKKKINRLEYDEIAPLKKEVNEIKVSFAENNILTKQAIEQNGKLSDTLQVVKDSMIQMAESIKVNNKLSGELADNVKTLSNQFVTLDKKVDDKFDEVDNKSKIDILTWIKQNWFGFVGTIAVLGYVISQIINK